MRFLITWLFIACVAVSDASAASAEGASEHTRARLILAADAAKAGDTVMAGLHLRMDPEWHVYWKNAGASGIPTTIDWELPAGVTAGPIQWPVPEKIPPEDFATYGYHKETVLLVPLKLAANLRPGPIPIRAKAAWLECRELCLSGSADLAVTLTISSETRPSADAALIERFRSQLPLSANVVARARWESAGSGNTRTLILEWESPAPSGEPDFYPDVSTQMDVEGETKRSVVDGKVVLRKPVRKLEGDWPNRVKGLLIDKRGEEHIGYEVDLGLGGRGAGTGSDAGAPAIGATPSLGRMLLYAFIGGIILNVMPCVLPVIALKILGFVSEARSNPAHVRRLGLIYALGVLVSFLALSGIVVAVQAAGKLAGWGMQFSNPYFLVVMSILVVLITLNLFGVFEVSPGGRALDAASALSARHGPAGAFFNGLLATVLATACTAPILGAAVGYAFSQSPLIIVLIFLTVGAGLAFPYVVLSWQPAWLKFLPKPGAWMEKFKVAMGFAMLAASIWLLSLVTIFYGERTWWLAMFLVIVALAAWIFGEFVQRGRARRGIALAAVGVLLATGYVFAFERQFEWRMPITAAAATTDSNQALPANLVPAGYDWQPWSLEAIEEARAAGQPVIVDFTAKWCINCQINVKPTLASRSVREKLTDLNAVALLADYTLRPDHMTEELRRFGRGGVPLVLVYPADANRSPIVLPEALTTGIVLDALNRAVSN